MLFLKHESEAAVAGGDLSPPPPTPETSESQQLLEYSTDAARIVLLVEPFPPGRRRFRGGRSEGVHLERRPSAPSGLWTGTAIRCRCACDGATLRGS